MDATLVYILVALVLVSTLALTGIVFISINQKTLTKLVPWLVAFAAGAILAVATFDLLPESLELLETAPYWIVGGILLFMLLENVLHIHHAHHEGEDDHHYKAVGHNILIGDALHNFLDGVLIASAFMLSIPVGVSVTIAVILHEIPQEIGDFAILLDSGFTKAKALWFNFASALMAVLGGLVTFFASQAVETVVPYLISLGAGAFLYISLVDIVGSFRHDKNMQSHPLRMLGVVLGLVVIGVIASVFPHEG